MTPRTTPPDPLLIAAHTSLCVRWGTTAPYTFGIVHGERVGFAQDPCVVVTVHCKARDIPGVVPVIRQRVYGELAERGWDPLTIEFTPSVQTGRLRKFRDINESSESLGKDKMGETHEFRFRMASPELITDTFAGPGFQSFRKLPTRKEYP